MMHPRFFPAPLLAIAALLCWANPSYAVTPTALTLKENGEILVATDSLPELQIRTDVKEVADGQWKPTKVVAKCAPAQGPSVERIQKYLFPDGTEIDHTVTAQIAGDSVDVAASWVANGNSPGFSRVDLWIPDTLLNDITVTIGDQTAFPFTSENQPIKTYTTGGPVVVKRASNGEFLFKLTGNFVNVTPTFYPTQPQNGLTLRLLNVPLDTTAKIGDKTSLNWSLSFKP